jgi:DNA (cytosine-5)-methyltransferase 1
MFSGIAGFELGIGDRGKCIGFSEIDKYAIQIYKSHFPTHTNYGDATRIIPEQLPDFDFLCGGVPCQSWSIAGKRGGFEDERGNMWFQYTKILRAKQPKYFLAENVKGLLSHNEGRSMERICEELCLCGYAIDFEVLNSKNFGVPQNRERVFIIGVRLDLLDDCQIF